MKFKVVARNAHLSTFFYGVFILYFVWGAFYPSNFHPLFIYVLGVVGAVLVLSDIYSSYAHKGLRVEIINKETRKYSGEHGEIAFRITQTGWLPIFGATFTILASDYILFDGDKKTRAFTSTKSMMRFSVMPKETVVVSSKYTTLERGVSRIFGSKIEYRNLLGFNEIILEQKSVLDAEIIVYPEVRMAKMHSFRLKNMDGNYQTQNALYHDRMLKIGSREYVHGDNLKDIHWKETARARTLRTNLYEEVTELDVLILVNLRSEKSYASVEYIEEIYEKIAYIAFQLTRDKIPYQLLSNVRHIHLRNFAHVPVGEGRAHYKRTLEFLSRLKSIDFTVPFEEVVRIVPTLNARPTHIIFTGPVNDEIAVALKALEKAQIRVLQLDKYDVVDFSKGAKHETVS